MLSRAGVVVAMVRILTILVSLRMMLQLLVNVDLLLLVAFRVNVDLLLLVAFRANVDLLLLVIVLFEANEMIQRKENVGVCVSVSLYPEVRTNLIIVVCRHRHRRRRIPALLIILRSRSNLHRNGLR